MKVYKAFYEPPNWRYYSSISSWYETIFATNQGYDGGECSNWRNWNSKGVENDPSRLKKRTLFGPSRWSSPLRPLISIKVLHLLKTYVRITNQMKDE